MICSAKIMDYNPPPSVFILGSPRSGTSILFKTLANHPSFACTTNLTRRFRANFTLVRIAELFGGKHRPVEAGELWNSFWPDGRKVRDEKDLTEYHRRMLEKIVWGHVRHFRRQVFLAKRPGISMRIRWLAAGLPNAKFVHVLRDGRAVANSILAKGRERGIPRWAYIGKDMWPDLAEMEPVAYCGAIWARTAMLTDRTLSTLEPERVLTLRYEDFVRRPLRIVGETAAFCGVPWGEDFEGIVQHLEDRNYKWKEQMSPEEQERMIEQARPGLDYFGYD